MTTTQSRRPTKRQIEAALSTLLLVSEDESLTGSERDAIAQVRSRLWDMLDA